MNFRQYQEEAMRTANWKSSTHHVVPPDVYCALKLNGEAGEVAEKVGKVYRDSNGQYSSVRLQALQLELGGVLWYIAGLCDTLGLSLELSLIHI